MRGVDPAISLRPGSSRGDLMPEAEQVTANQAKEPCWEEC